MTDKELKDWCKTCNVEPPAMRFKCPECEHNPDKEQIMINGVDVGGCRFYQIKANKLYPKAQYCGSMRNIFCEDNPNCYFKQLARKTQECEELKEKYLNLKEQNGSFIVQLNTVNERLDQLKAENEELKKEIINKDEKIKELRFSVSDLTNRLCFLNGEKSFRIVDLEQALDEIAAHYQKVIKNITNYDDSYDASISIKALHNISDIINKAKGEGNEDT